MEETFLDLKPMGNQKYKQSKESQYLVESSVKASDSEILETDWKYEAEAVVADIRDHVETVFVSDQLQSSCSRIYINLTTFEKDPYTVELTAQGFRIVGNRHDSANEDRNEVFETPYSLLDSISPMYRESFEKALEDKLILLKYGEDDNQDEDS